MDKIDYKIIELLQKNARYPLKHLAEEVYLSTPAVSARIEKLEEVCKSFEGVQSSFAMQSGREVRVMVVPEKINDMQAYKLARDIKDKIENEMTYPGQIKVSVIREVRATETAK